MKKMSIISKYQETGDLTEIIDLMNSQCLFKLTEHGCGLLLRKFLDSPNFIKNYDESKDNESKDKLIDLLHDFLFDEVIYDPGYESLWDPSTKDELFKEARKLIDKLEIKKKLLLEICPRAERMTKACRK